MHEGQRHVFHHSAYTLLIDSNGSSRQRKKRASCISNGNKGKQLALGTGWPDLEISYQLITSRERDLPSKGVGKGVVRERTRQRGEGSWRWREPVKSLRDKPTNIGLACHVGEGSGRARRAERVRRPRRPCPATHESAVNTSSASVPTPSIQYLPHLMQGVQPHVCSVSAHACKHACHLPVRPYDPSEQGGPLHTEAPAERERAGVVPSRICASLQSSHAF